MKVRILLRWGVFLGLLLSFTACTNNQEQTLTQIQSQISVLSNEMRESFKQSEEERIELYQQLNDDVKLLQKNQADTSVITDELQADLQAIDAKLDEYNARMERLRERLDTSETALTERITLLSDQVSEIGRETTISPGPSPQQQQPSQPQQPSDMPLGSPDSSPTPTGQPGQQPPQAAEPNPEASQLYHNAYTAYVNGNFDTAIAGFEKYANNYPDTELADIAQYWIAESFFSLGEYETALREYDRLINRYPNSDKIPAAYFSKADVYLKLDRQIEAISHLEYITKQFPDSAAARQAAERLRALGQ